MLWIKGRGVFKGAEPRVSSAGCDLEMECVIEEVLPMDTSVDWCEWV